MKLSLVFFRRLTFFGGLLIQSFVLSAQSVKPSRLANSDRSAQSAFTVIPLGVRGGLDESNLSAYLVAPAGGADYICMDAGTLYAGLAKAVASGLFTQPPGAVLRSHVKGYFISHPHLDHVAGLIINSPDDTAKNIYGLPACLATLQEKYFSWKSWANFGDEGEKPQLKKYHYVPMEPGREIPADNTPMFVQAFPLSHGRPFESTAFLVRSGSQYLLYLGDTGADSVEGSDRLHTLWTAVAPLVKSGALRAIFIEVSFPNEQPIKSLFGHLTPALLQQEMRALATLTSAANTAAADPAKSGGSSAFTPSATGTESPNESTPANTAAADPAKPGGPSASTPANTSATAHSKPGGSSASTAAATGTESSNEPTPANTSAADPAEPGGPSASTPANTAAADPSKPSGLSTSTAPTRATVPSTSGADALTRVSIIITHRKPVGNQEETIKRQLQADNPLHLKLVFPEQGHRLDF